jgi:hypothetical protein
MVDEAPHANNTPAKDRSLLQALCVALLVGLGLVAGGLYFASIQADLLLNGASAVGRVAAVEAGSSTSSSGRPGFFPVVEFVTEHGNTVRFRHRTGQNPPAYVVGDEVRVTYLPDAPDGALIDEAFKNWLLPGLLLLIGAGLSVISVKGIAGARRRLRLA